MKVNIFIPTRSGGKFASGELIHSGIVGEQLTGPVSPEDEIITSFDEERMSVEKIIATRFMKFLGNRRIAVSDLKDLPREEQQRLKKEFIES